MGLLDNLQIDPNDMIAALSAQRSAAMDEIARQAAIINALQKCIKEFEHPSQTVAPTGGVTPSPPVVEPYGGTA